MFGHFGVHFKVFGRRVDSRGWYGRKKIVSSFVLVFMCSGAFGEILVLGSIPGVGKVKFFIFFSIWWSGGVSMDKKDVVAKPLRGG